MPTLGERIYVRIRENKANAYLADDGRLMLKNANRLSADLKAYIVAHADDLMAHVERLRDDYEERAAIVEEGAKVPRAVAEEAARQMVYAIPFAPEEDRGFLMDSCCEVIDRVIGPYVEQHRAAA